MQINKKWKEVCKMKRGDWLGCWNSERIIILFVLIFRIVFIQYNIKENDLDRICDRYYL